MKKLLILCSLLTSFNSFAMSPTDSVSIEKENIPNLEEILNTAEQNATTEGRKILETSRLMIANEEIILGSCWDYIDGAYTKAGFSENQRVTVFKSKLQGPYVALDKIASGDWLYFINHSYGDVEHSAIFVAWMDPDHKMGLMISYAGGNQAVPARYRAYDLSSVYNIIRPR